MTIWLPPLLAVESSHLALSCEAQAIVTGDHLQAKGLRAGPPAVQFQGTIHFALCVDVPLELDTEVRLWPYS